MWSGAPQHGAGDDPAAGLSADAEGQFSDEGAATGTGRAAEAFRDFGDRGTPVAEAIVTAGGVKVSEVKPNTMESKLVEGLYFAGEILDVDAYTGGFNLQIAWRPAIAGVSAAERE